MKYKESFNQSTTCPNWKERAAQNPDDAVASIFAWVGQTITEPSQSDENMTTIEKMQERITKLEKEVQELRKAKKPSRICTNSLF